MKKILILLFTFVLLLSCEDEKNEETFEVFLNRQDIWIEGIFSNSPDYGNIDYPVNVLEWRTRLEDNDRLYEVLYLCRYSKYSISATKNMFLQEIRYDWEHVMFKKPSLLNWNYEFSFSGMLDEEHVLTGTSPFFMMENCNDINVSGGDTDSESDSLARIQIHDVLDYYTEYKYLPFTVTIKGLYEKNLNENIEFEYIHLDSFATIIDSTEWN